MTAPKKFFFRAASLLLLLLQVAPWSRAFCLPRAVVVRPTVTAMRYRDNRPDDQQPEEQDTWIEQEKRLFDHDDWVEYRNDSDEKLDVFWAIFGLFTCYLLVVAVLI